MIISCDKSGLLLGEPLVVSVTLTNAGPTNVSFSPSLFNGTSHAGYMVSLDGRDFQWIGSMVVHDPPAATKVLSSGDTFKHEQVLVYDGRTDGLALPRENDYFVRVDYRGHKSNVLKIQVKSPESESDVKWTRRLGSKEVLHMLTLPSWRTDAAVKVLNECASETSTYSPYAVFALASGDKNKTNALAMFGRLDIAGFPLRSQALLGQARINEELGNIQTARQQFERIVNEFPNTSAATDARRILATLAPVP